MFEKLMFWKKSEDSHSSFSASSLHPLDVQSPPSFGDSQGSPNYAPQPNFDPNTGMPAYNNGMNNSMSSGMSGSTGVDPFASPMQQASPTGFGQPTFSSPNPMMQQLQMQNSLTPISTNGLPSRSMQADPNVIHPRDVELILSRLELIRAEIENVNHRLSYLEQAQLPDNRSGKLGQKAKNWY